MRLCSGGGQFADSEKWTPTCAGPILGRWIYFVRLKWRGRAAAGSAVCSVCDRNRTVLLCKLYSERDVERWICHGSKPAELFQVWLYLKTINLLDFPCWVLVQERWLPIVHLHNSKIYQSSSLDRCQKRYHCSVTLALHWKVLFINLVSLWTTVVFLPLVSLPRIFHLLLYICFVEKTLQ